MNPPWNIQRTGHAWGEEVEGWKSSGLTRRCEWEILTFGELP